MVMLEDAVNAMIAQIGKEPSDVKEVRMDDTVVPMKLIIEFKDGTEAFMEIDLREADLH